MLTTDTDLAAKFGITVETLHKLRRRYGWPCVRLGRWDIRFTDAQVDQIVRLHSEAPRSIAAVGAIPGQTTRSAKTR